MTEEALIKLGKKLRKNNVAVDIITFGEEAGQGETVLQKFVDTVGSESRSVPPCFDDGWGSSTASFFSVLKERKKSTSFNEAAEILTLFRTTTVTS